MNEINERNEKIKWVEDVQSRADAKIVGQYMYDMNCKDPESVVKRRLKDLPILGNGFIHWQKKRNGNRYKYMMITINFTEGTPFDIVTKKVEKVLKKVWIVNAMYCYEWRNENEKTPHVHMRVELKNGKNPYKCRGEVFNTVKNFVGNKMHVFMNYSNDEKAFIEYVNGLKDGKPKKNAQDDAKKRKECGLESVYFYKKS